MRHAVLRWCGAVTIGVVASLTTGLVVDVLMVGPDHSNRRVYAIVGASACAALLVTPTLLMLMWRGVRVSRSVAWSVAAALAAMVIGVMGVMLVGAMGTAESDGS